MVGMAPNPDPATSLKAKSEALLALVERLCPECRKTCPGAPDCPAIMALLQKQFEQEK
jgi:hypothetical protein